MGKASDPSRRASRAATRERYVCGVGTCWV